MNRVFPFVLASVVAASFAAPTLAQYGGGGGNAHQPLAPIDPKSNDQQGDFVLPPEPEARAEGLRLQGECEKAIPIFRALARRAGFEIAQYNLGLCLIDVSKKQSDAQQAEAFRKAGAESILKAANGNLASAQLRLVGLYLDGIGVARDPVEAAKWSLIYRDNGTRFVLGLPAVPESLQTRLDGALDQAGWTQAQSRADAWTPARPEG